MCHSKLDDWPCYKYGHSFGISEFNKGYQSVLIGKDASIKCSRCGREVECKNVQNPIMKMATTQRDIVRPFLPCVTPQSA